MGHIRICQKPYGVDVKNNFEPKYINIVAKVIDIRVEKEAKDANKIYLATDPDREGELFPGIWQNFKHR